MEPNNSDARQLNNPALLEKVKEITAELIEHPEVKEAYNLAKQLEEKIAELKILNPEFFSQYQMLITQLKIIALPMLSEEEAVEIIQRHFINAIEAEIDLEDRLNAMFFTLTFTPRDELRKKLYLTLIDNREKIGLWSIKEWLADYDNFADPKKRTNISSVEYLTQKREAQSLVEKEKRALRKLFHLYDNLLLVTPVITEPMLSETFNKIVGQSLRKTNPPPAETPALSSNEQLTPPPPAPPSEPIALEEPQAPPRQTSSYQEPISQQDLAGPAGAKKVEPRIDGNVVDLSQK